MSFSRTKRFIIALLAQITLCLAFAPVIASGQSPRQSSRGDSPERENASIAAFDAGDARLEEGSDSDKKAVKARASADSVSNRSRKLSKVRTELENFSGDTAVPAVVVAQTVGRSIAQQDLLLLGSTLHGRDGRVTGKVFKPATDRYRSLQDADGPQCGPFGAPGSDHERLPAAIESYAIHIAPPLSGRAVIGDCIQPTGPPTFAR